VKIHPNAHRLRISLPMDRVVIPELLDSLPADDPSAVRSRRDLSRINAMMGNLRWLRRSIATAGLGPDAHVVEVGAGDGALANALAGDGFKVTAIDLSPPPADLQKDVTWIRGDLFEELPRLSGDVLVGNLFWHHFGDELLADLGAEVGKFRVVLAAEPMRARFPQVLGVLLVPFINKVTRHDMFVSIRAGFKPGELPALWQLNSGQWQLEEATGVLGACRLAAHRC